MKVQIQIIKNVKETTLPIIKLTKSLNGKTGTATFIFIRPLALKYLIYKKVSINGIYLLWDNKKIETRDVKILFKNGKPFLLKTIFIFKNSYEWFNFLNFMNHYSRDTGLSFAEKK
jgi:photosystem II protein